MNRKKLIILSAVVLTTIGGTIVLNKTTTLAETTYQYSPLIQKIVDKFNLDKTEVNKLIEEDRTDREKQQQEMEAKRQADIETKLEQAVKDGKITEEQKANILVRLAEMKPSKPQGERIDFSKLTDDQRKTKMEEMKKAMEQRKADFEAWEKQLGVNLKDTLGDIPFYGGPQGPMGHDGFFGRPPETPVQ